MNCSKLRTLFLSMVAISSCAVNAAEGLHLEVPYVGAALGRASFGTRNLSLPKAASDETDTAAKIYAGYRLTDHFGVEAGYVRLGSMSETFTVGGVAVEQSARARSLYLAGTGRLPVSKSVALTGKVGLSFGKVSGANVLPAGAEITGSRRSFMYGLGAEVQLSPSVALTADFDHFGKVSDKVRANMVSAGVRYSF